MSDTVLWIAMAFVAGVWFASVIVLASLEVAPERWSRIVRAHLTRKAARMYWHEREGER